MDDKLAAYLNKILTEQSRQADMLRDALAELARQRETQANLGAAQTDMGAVQAEMRAAQAEMRTAQADMGAAQAEMRTVQADMGATQRKQGADLVEIKDLLKAMYPLLISAHARGEEQSKRIDDHARILTSLIPQKLAAVGDR